MQVVKTLGSIYNTVFIYVLAFSIYFSMSCSGLFLVLSLPCLYCMLHVHPRVIVCVCCVCVLCVCVCVCVFNDLSLRNTLYSNLTYVGCMSLFTEGGLMTSP